MDQKSFESLMNKLTQDDQRTVNGRTISKEFLHGWYCGYSYGVSQAFGTMQREWDRVQSPGQMQGDVAQWLAFCDMFGYDFPGCERKEGP